MKNSMEGSQKIKNRIAIWSSNSILGYISKGVEKSMLEIPVFPYLLQIISSQDMESTYPPDDE
jgi:hypothetical protein